MVKLTQLSLVFAVAGSVLAQSTTPSDSASAAAPAATSAADPTFDCVAYEANDKNLRNKCENVDPTGNATFEYIINNQAQADAIFRDQARCICDALSHIEVDFNKFHAQCPNGRTLGAVADTGAVARCKAGDYLAAARGFDLRVSVRGNGWLPSEQAFSSAGASTATASASAAAASSAATAAPATASKSSVAPSSTPSAPAGGAKSGVASLGMSGLAAVGAAAFAGLVLA
ncbi:hypothetical protein HDU88_005757 [Geranomyces variabilis]|nr:hypothetical protein HDU88_005757 [Geranomyces variabilis]